MMQRAPQKVPGTFPSFPWLKSYPKGIPSEVDVNQFQSITELFEISVAKYRERVAFTNMGAEMTFEDLQHHSTDFASYLVNVAKLNKGDRIALMMPNMLQYPIVLYGALRAGLVVVNTNPLYTAREMLHQFRDSGVKAIVIFANSAAKLEEILPETSIETVVVTQVGDMLGFPKSLIVNGVIKYIKKMVPDYNLPMAHSFYEALDLGAAHHFTEAKAKPDDLAFLQYTGGTTGVAKGAELTHKNILSNMLQVQAYIRPLVVEGEETVVLALPLYHIFSLTVNTFIFLYVGGTNIMITNPRDIPDLVKTLKKNPYSIFVGLNTLFNALMNNEEFKKLDFSKLKISVAGGMALQKATGERWLKTTGTKVIEGYGLTETSPVAACNPVDGTDRVGTIGLPIPNTEIKLLDDDGNEVPPGESGEICVRGPQVMRCYWNQPEETAKVMTKDGFFKTGDIGVLEEGGFFRIVDRKKDMILVSGFNVYPNEVEDVIAHHPKVLEVAAIGVPDEHSSEVVKIFVVKKDESLTSDELMAFCKDKLTGYKRPKQIEFRKELPKSPVGKILRRELREPLKD